MHFQQEGAHCLLWVPRQSAETRKKKNKSFFIAIFKAD